VLCQVGRARKSLRYAKLRICLKKPLGELRFRTARLYHAAKIAALLLASVTNLSVASKLQTAPRHMFFERPSLPRTKSEG
jgi:hypothetical protein